MSGIDAAGEIIGGGLAGRAVEHELSADEKGHGDRPHNCLNCGAPLTGDFCANCGQKGHLHRTLRGLLHDLMHGVLHLDGKFWNTLPKLIWKPGELTRDYIEGKRARYISPIAFYLFTVVAMFALVVSVGDISSEDIGNGDLAPAATIEEQRDRVSDLEASLAEMAADEYPGASNARAGVQASINTAKAQLADMEAGGDGNVRAPIMISGQDDIASSGLGGLGEGLAEAASSFQQDPTLFLYKVQTKAYKLSWLLIPMSLPFMWLLFPFSRRWKMYDHAVFVTYSISFMMVLVLLIGFANWIGVSELGVVVAVFYAPIHLYRHIKGTYSLGRISAFLRTLALCIITWVVLGLFLSIMMTLGAVS